MKLKRLVATMLALLLMVSLLPIGAMATDNEDNYATISTPIDTNTGSLVTVTETGSIQTNDGNVDKNEGTVGTNNGSVGINYDTVKTNELMVATNKGTVVTNTDTGLVGGNEGTVKTNDGTVWTNRNSGTIETNNGTVGRIDEEGQVRSDSCNFGTVETNNGTVLINQERGTIGTNNGTVEKNYGTVETNGIDGVVNNYNAGGVVAASNDDAIETPTEQPPAVAGIGTNFGTVHNKVDRNTYYGLSWGESVDKLNSIESFVAAGTEGINLDEIANGVKRSGYKMTDYTAFARKEGKDVEIDNIADYAMNAPTWLQILWEKLGGKSTQPTRTPVYTKLSADQVKVGAFLRVGDCIFKIIEVNEDNIRVATVKQLPEKALTDMLGFLKQYLSDAQIAKFQGEPELLEEELVAKFFSGSNEHIAFYASPDLFA